MPCKIMIQHLLYLTLFYSIPGRSEGVRSVELDAGPDLLDPGAVEALHHLLLDLVGLLDGLHGCLLTISGGSSLLRCGLLALRLVFLWCHSSGKVKILITYTITSSRNHS